MSQGRPPDYALVFCDKRNNEENRAAGVAWNNAHNGTINITLAPGVTMRRDKKMMVRLYPMEKSKRKRWERKLWEDNWEGYDVEYTPI